jgi:OOP family OmpA-OmpF porin
MELPINLLDPTTYGNVLNMIPGMSLPALPDLTGGQQGGVAFPFNLMPALPGMPAPTAAAQPMAAAQPAAAPAAKAAAAPAPAAFAVQAGVASTLTLGGDALFKTGKSSVKDLTPAARAQLDELVAKIKAFGAIDSIKVTGHADKMGKATANQKLSLARAKAIADYLRSKGVKAASFTTAGMGDSKPVVDCDMNQAKEALKACLAPNRRVEIEVVGAKQ